MSTATTNVEALGGWDNISNLEACITRIRLDAANTDLIDEAKLPQHMYAMLAATAGVTSVSVAGDTVDALPVMIPSTKSVFGEAHYSFTLAPTLGFDHAEATGAAVLDGFFPDEQFETVIHASSKVCEGSWQWKPVAAFEPGSRPARDYEALADEVYREPA